ncbi:MAG: hypothetical protein V4506_16000 [Bacteroidota bacterium]
MKQLSKEEALKRISAIDVEVKELRKIIESEEKQGPILDRLHSFEDACRIKGVLPNDIVRFPSPKNDWEIAKNAEDQLEFIIEVAVEDWVCNWNDSNQKKWIPVFDFSSAGFVFYDTNCNYTYTYSGLGSRLPTQEMATIIGKRFIHLYKLILTKPKRK